MNTTMTKFLALKAMYEKFDNKSLIWTLDEVINKPNKMDHRIALLAVIEDRLNASDNTNTFDDTMKALDEFEG